MEVISRNESGKKKRKKKKQSVADECKKSFAKPENFDGMTNWLNLQKVLDIVQKEKVPENSSSPQGSTDKPKKDNSNKKQQKKAASKNIGNKALSKNSGNKAFSKNSGDKANFKFNFSERHSVILASQNRSNNSSKGDSQRKQSESEMSDDNADTVEPTQLTKVLAMDCEMVGTGSDGVDSMIARVSIVNSYGDCVYDEYVTPREKVTDYRTDVSGIRPSDLKKGKDLFEVQKDVLEILEGRRIVGHDLKHDFDVLFISHPRYLIRDTSKYKPFRDLCGGRTPSLKKLVAIILGCNIQGGEHSSVEDAQAAMLLYLKHKKEWERSLKTNRRRHPVS